TPGCVLHQPNHSRCAEYLYPARAERLRRACLVHDHKGLAAHADLQCHRPYSSSQQMPHRPPLAHEYCLTSPLVRAARHIYAIIVSRKECPTGQEVAASLTAWE